MIISYMSMAVGQMDKEAGGPTPALGRVGAIKRYLASFVRKPGIMPGNFEVKGLGQTIAIPGGIGGTPHGPGNFSTVSAPPSATTPVSMMTAMSDVPHSAGLPASDHNKLMSLGAIDGDANGAGKALPVNFSGMPGGPESAPGLLDSLWNKGRNAWDYSKKNPWHVGGGVGALGAAGWAGHSSGYDDGGREVGSKTYQAGLQAGGAASRQAASDAGFLSRFFGDGGQSTASNALATLGGPQTTQNVVNRILSQS